MTVSVVIPCRNEEQYIRACVESVVGNDYPAELLTVLICDGQSDDSTREIVSEMAKQHPQVQLVDNPYRTTPYALNLGIKATDSDVVIILGGHAELQKDYISQCISQLEEHPEVGCIGGIIDNVAENQTAEIVSKAMSSSFGVGNAHFRTGGKEGYVDTVAFGAYRRTVFNQIGYFDEDLTRNQDDEFNYRVLKNDFKIWLSPRIRSRYFVRASFQKLFRQYYQYGYWKVFVNRKHKAITTVRQLIPLFFVLFIIGGLALAWLHPLLSIAFGFTLSLYFLLALLFAFKVSTGIQQALGVVYTFFILHLGYGLGYLQGIIRFLILNQQPTKSSTKLTR